MWALERKESGEFLGMVGFADPEGWPGCELAWTLARRDFLGKEVLCYSIDRESYASRGWRSTSPGVDRWETEVPGRHPLSPVR